MHLCPQLLEQIKYLLLPGHYLLPNTLVILHTLILCWQLESICPCIISDNPRSNIRIGCASLVCCFTRNFETQKRQEPGPHSPSQQNSKALTSSLLPFLLLMFLSSKSVSATQDIFQSSQNLVFYLSQCPLNHPIHSKSLPNPQTSLSHLWLPAPGRFSSRLQAQAHLLPWPSMPSCYQDPTCHRASRDMPQQQISLFSALPFCTICTAHSLFSQHFLLEFSFCNSLWWYLFVYVCPNIENISTPNITPSFVEKNIYSTILFNTVIIPW